MVFCLIIDHTDLDHCVKKETPTQVFSYEIYEIFKSNYLEEPLRTTAFGNVCS